jgi:hypothetical protein
VAFAVAVLLAPLASSAPDGLERVALDFGFARFAENPIVGLAPDYLVPGIEAPGLAVAVAGVLGVAGVFAVSYVIGRKALCRVSKH